jgi:hypothetical protein
MEKIKLSEILSLIPKVAHNFGIKLFKKLSTDKNNNETISPISLFCALITQIFILFH